MTKILSIETSCDETSAAVVKDGVEVLSNPIATQTEFHQKYGGIVPEIAARKHVELISPIIQEALDKANITFKDIDAVAVTYGPGLIGSLIVGVCAAKAIAWTQKIPLIGVNHLEGHIYANLLISNFQFPISNLFPFLCLLVSGGHTMIVHVKGHGNYETLGRTQDDAAGEAFDKVARILGLGYPGGPSIAAQAANYELRIKNYESSCDDLISNDEKLFKGNIKKPIFPRPMLHSHDFNFSFSGLKTSVLYYVKNYRKENNLAENSKLPLKFVRETAYEFQEAATDILVIKTIQAAQKYNPKTIFIA